MKKYSLIVMVVLVMLSGCGGKKQQKQVDLIKMMSHVEEQFSTTILVELNNSDFYDLFELDPSQVKQVVYKMAFLDIKADEIVMIQLSDESLVDQVETKLFKIVDELRSEFDTYIPEQKAIVDQAIVFSEGRYVFLIVNEQATAIQDYVLSQLGS